MTSKVVRNPSHVFINCPFDAAYTPKFHAIVFTVVRCGFKARCALENIDTGEVRIQKIVQIIKECPLGIHDISRTEIDENTGFPRFNMPFELGLYLGARHYGDDAQRRKRCLVLDLDRYRFRDFISDLGGQDPEAHGDSEETCIEVVRDFLNNASGPIPLPGGAAMVVEYRRFKEELPVACDTLDLEPHRLQFNDFLHIVGEWVTQRSV
ncbi:MAG: hypothetical protein ACU0BS_03320 [Hasllibacter sp.]